MISYQNGPQRDAIPVAVDFEWAASAKVCETASRVTVFTIGGSELNLNEMTVAGQGS